MFFAKRRINSHRNIKFGAAANNSSGVKKKGIWMIALRLGQLGHIAILASSVFAASAAVAQQLTPIKISLDFKFEGPAAPFVVAIDKGYFKAEGLDVTIDPAAGSLEPINRVASGTYDMGFGDINSLIKFRDTNPGTPIKAVF